MARRVRGAGLEMHMGLATRRGAEVERMSPAARKAYLRRQLLLVEAQIGVVLDGLSHRGRPSLDAPPGPAWAGLSWAGSPMNERRWENLFDLGYLVAERDALEEAISRL